MPNSADPETTPAVVELRQYTLHPGQRDVLVELFDRRFVESQEAVGARVLGQFTDLDDPDRFVWLRGFTDMASRRDALEAFYGGPVWAAHRAAANATMVDFDDVLLLRPVTPAPAWPPPFAPRPPTHRAAGAGTGLVAVGSYPLAGPDLDGFAAFFAARVEPVLTRAGGEPLAVLRTEPAPNTYPVLPVRTDCTVYVRIARFPTAAAHAAYLVRLERDPTWPAVRRALAERLAGAPRHLRLRPTARSLLR